MEQVAGNWQGPISEPTRFSAKGRAVQLEIAALAAGPATRPGFKGVDIEFDLNQAGGRASLVMKNGALDLPGIFDEPVMPLDALEGDVQWKLEGSQISLAIPNLRFSNTDAQGDLQLKWQTATNTARFPGVLDLQGNLSRANGARVYRYLPLGIDQPVRDYLREAILSGSASGVKFKVKGNLNDFPFATAKQGDFRIVADVHNATFAYAPAFLLPKDSPPWPVVNELSGELIIDRAVLQVKGASARVVGMPGLRVGKAEAVVDNLYHGATVAVAVEAQGPLTDVLGVVNGSPLSPLMGKALDRATATGPADYKFKLAFPIADVDRATVRGSVTLSGNDLQITPETPRLGRARGVIHFSDTGFALTGAQARALGGDVRLEGGMSSPGSAHPVPGVKAPAPQQLRMQGSATAEGLRQARELGFAAGQGWLNWVSTATWSAWR